MPFDLKRRLTELELGDHLQLVYADEEERLSGLVPAVTEAFRRGHRCLYFAAVESVETALGALTERGLDPEARIREGALQVFTDLGAGDDEGEFDLDALVDRAVAEIDRSLEDGWNALWWIVEMPWHRLDATGEVVAHFEARLFDEVRTRPVVAICQFDRRRLSEDLLARVIQVHSLAGFRDEYSPNPFYIPPAAVLDDGTSRADWMLRQIERGRATERRLRRSEERLRTILEHAPDVIVRLDRELRYVYVNPAFERYAGIPASEIVGRTLGAASPDSVQLAAWRDGIRRALETGDEQRVEGPLVTMERGTRWFESRIVGEPGPEGESDTALILARDVTEERRARHEVEEAARVFRKTLESLDEAVFIVDPHERRIVHCNRTAEVIFGYPRDELVGGTTRKLHVDDESFRDFAAACERASSAGDAYRGAHRMRRRSGEVFPTEHVVTPLHPEEGPGSQVVSVVRDVSEEREAREALELYAHRLDSLRQLDLALLQARSEEAILERATERIRELVGAWRVSVLLFAERRTASDGGDPPEAHLMAFSTSGSAPKPAAPLPLEQDPPDFAAVRAGRIRRCDEVTEEEALGLPPELDLHALGLRSYFAVPLRIDDRVAGALTVGYDEPGGFSEMAVELAREMASHLGLALGRTRLLERVERATAEREAAEARAERLAVRLDGLLDSLDVGVARLAPDGAILEVNEAYSRILGFTSHEELHGRNVREFMVQPERWSEIVARSGGGELPPDTEHRLRRTDGATIWVAGSSRRIRTDEGTEVIEGVLRDVTKRKRLEERMLEIGVEERRRIGRELHDQLGQQLTGIAFLARTLAGEGAADPESARAIEDEARDAITRIRHLARGLDSADLDAQGLPDALAELAAESRRLFDAEVELSVDPELSLGGDEPLHLYRIAQEAVTNAVRHGHATRIRIGLCRGDAGRVLEVRDDGVGLDETPADPQGMGLRTMRHRCESVGGELEISVRPGGGTTIRCRLPAEPPHSRGRETRP